jgi:hypothetical protein
VTDVGARVGWGGVTLRGGGVTRSGRGATALEEGTAAGHRSGVEEGQEDVTDVGARVGEGGVTLRGGGGGSAKISGTTTCIRGSGAAGLPCIH